MSALITSMKRNELRLLFVCMSVYWSERLKYLFFAMHVRLVEPWAVTHTRFNDKHEINVYFILLMNF